MSVTKYRIVRVELRTGWSTACMRRSSASVNSGRGSTGMIGRQRVSSGSTGISACLSILAAQGGARAGQERLGSMDTSSQVLGYGAHPESVQVEQCERGALR